MPADPRTVTRAWCAALNRHDPDAVAACFAADATFTDHGTGQRTQGRTAVRESTEDWLKVVSDLRVEEICFIGSDTYYSRQWIMSGRLTGDLPGLPATGRSFTVHGSGHGEVRNGEIVSATLYWNMADLVDQVVTP